MARMSLDDAVLRDPRITLLSQLLGWSRRETLGCLIEIWAVCYDRVDSALGVKVINLIAQRDGFADLMLEVELAANMPSGKLRIAGAKERIAYLANLKQWGREGGIKSAKSKSINVKGSDNPPVEPPVEPSGKPPHNPIPSVPDPSVPLIPSSAPNRRGRKPRAASASVEIPLPTDWQPTKEHAALAAERGVDLNLEARRFRAHADTHDRRAVRWNGAFTQWLLKASPERGGKPASPTRVTATTAEYDEPPQPVLAEILR